MLHLQLNTIIYKHYIFIFCIIGVLGITVAQSFASPISFISFEAPQSDKFQQNIERTRQALVEHQKYEKSRNFSCVNCKMYSPIAEDWIARKTFKFSSIRDLKKESMSSERIEDDRQSMIFREHCDPIYHNSFHLLPNLYRSKSHTLYACAPFLEQQNTEGLSSKHMAILRKKTIQNCTLGTSHNISVLAKKYTAEELEIFDCYKDVHAKDYL
jgi:hypothetical protein